MSTTWSQRLRAARVMRDGYLDMIEQLDAIYGDAKLREQERSILRLLSRDVIYYTHMIRTLLEEGEPDNDTDVAPI